MKRWELIKLLTRAVIAWPLSAGAQQSSKQWRIGVPMTLPPAIQKLMRA